MTEHIETDKIPTDALEQDVPVGGVVDGKMPSIAIQTVSAGISTTREVPALRLNAFGATQPQNAAGVEPFRIGRETRRRRIHVAVAPNASATAYIVIAATREQAMNGDGYPLPPNGRVTLEAADMMWIASIGAALQWGFLVELDQG
jgi:hypothetical protein